MSTLKSCSILNPYNENDECAQFVIDVADEQFTIADVAPLGVEYTFSTWVRSESDGNLIIRGVNIPTSTTWQRHTFTFVSDNEDLIIDFSALGTYYIYHPKLEIGNIATDWSPAPEDAIEDMENAINSTTDDINNTIIEQRAELVTTYEGIIMSALKTYVEETEYNTFRETMESELKLLADEMTLRFTQTVTDMGQLDSDLNDKLNTITKYFTFNIDGLTIGQVDNPNQVIIDNDEISILVNGVAVQRFDASGEAIIPELNITKAFNLLGLVIDVDSYGNINCEYVGGV